MLTAMFSAPESDRFREGQPGRGGFARALAALSFLFYRWAQFPLLLVSILVFSLFIFLVLPEMSVRLAAASGSGLSPDTSLFYSAAELYEMAAAYGTEGRAYYVSTRFTFDLAWPLAYLLFLSMSLSFLLPRALGRAQPTKLNLLPLGAFLFDLLENSAVALVFHLYPRPLPLAASLAPWFTLIKWLFVSASFLLLLLILVLSGYNTWRQARSKRQ